MNDTQSHPFLFPVLLSLFLLWLINKWFLKPKGSKNSPPSPPKLPILGNIHQLGSLPHRNLQSLAKNYGPFMLLHFGSVPILIVSSAAAASEILKTHDVAFANRPQYKAFKKLVYDAKNITFSPYGEYWRKLKSIFVLQLLSSKRVQSFRHIREDETAIFVKKIREFKGPINLSEMFGEFSNDLICRSAFGLKYRELGNEKILKLLVDLMELLGTISIGDFIPMLRWIDRINGFDERLDKVAQSMDDFLEEIIQQRTQDGRRKTAADTDGNNFLDILLKIHDENAAGDSIGIDGIKSLIMDALAGGTDTASTVLEWLMTELLLHPTVMEKLQNEVREIVKDKQDISDDDLEKMVYLKAIIKETLRYHPPIALLVPRIIYKDVNVNGYDISNGTIAIVNVWAISRDPESWDEPEKFKPERFLNSSIDFKGSNFGLIPFGSGRRSCPGMAYGMATVELALANVVHKFDWKLPDGVVMDTTECAGLTTHRANPLIAIASQTT